MVRDPNRWVASARLSYSHGDLSFLRASGGVPSFVSERSLEPGSDWVLLEFMLNACGGSHGILVSKGFIAVFAAFGCVKAQQRSSVS